MGASPVPIRWRLMKIGQWVHRAMYAAGMGPLVGRIILLLTTTGRKTGRPRVTPLQYEEVDGALYVAAARGPQADWVRNLLADPHIRVQLKERCFTGLAEPVSEPKRIADFLELRLQRHPRMVGAMMRMHALPPRPSRQQLEELAAHLTLVMIRPNGASS
jgi:deazaflavin-dependent oxidoreductase (nitroreductase family)